MLGNRSRPRIPLPKQWPSRVRSGVLHAISLAHVPLTYTRSWAAEGLCIVDFVANPSVHFRWSASARLVIGIESGGNGFDRVAGHNGYASDGP